MTSSIHHSARRLLAAAVVLATLATPGAAFAADPMPKGGKHRVVMQVSDGDAARWNLALNNMQNVQSELGRDNVEAEIVAYGPGIQMLKMDSSVGPRIDAALKSGVRVVACENTMNKQKLTKADMLPSIGYVRAGVVELIEKQREGYAYIRP